MIVNFRFLLAIIYRTIFVLLNSIAIVVLTFTMIEFKEETLYNTSGMLWKICYREKHLRNYFFLMVSINKFPFQISIAARNINEVIRNRLFVFVLRIL